MGCKGRCLEPVRGECLLQASLAGVGRGTLTPLTRANRQQRDRVDGWTSWASQGLGETSSTRDAQGPRDRWGSGGLLGAPHPRRPCWGGLCNPSATWWYFPELQSHPHIPPWVPEP